jgi:hypothetical protein
VRDEKVDDRLWRAGFGAVGRTFRGTIWENAARFKFHGGGYAAMPKEQDGHFWIESANQMRGPLTALNDPLVRLVHLIGATQVLKSMAGDLWVQFVCEHVARNMLVLFEDDPKAKLFCAIRLMETLRKHPVLSQWLAAGERFDATNTRLKLPGMILQVCGLNDGNVSSLSWPLVWISEAWQHGRDGLMWKAYKRTDRFPDDYKILNESQASEAGSDLHVSAREAAQVPLTWSCPACDGRQTWEWEHWNHRRSEAFVPREPKNKNGWTAPKPGSYAGMIIPDDADGTRSIQNRAAGAYWDCIWCGHHIEDTRATRQALMDSYDQSYCEPGKLTPAKLTFTLPFESARDNHFSATVENFLIAKHEERQGNSVKLAQWFMAERAVFFTPEFLQPQIIQVAEIFDPNTKIPNWHHDGMTIDCQKHKTLDTVGTFHWSVDTADKNGNSFEMMRGFAESWEELAAVQKKYKIRNKYVMIDGRKWTPEILWRAAMYRELDKGVRWGKVEDYWSCWTVLLGDAPMRNSYQWADKQWRLWAPAMRRVENVVDEHGKRFAVSVFMFRWANTAVADLLNEILIGGEGKVKFVAQKREALAPKDQRIEEGDMAYDAQMGAELRTTKNGRPTWLKIGNRPNHRLDIARMRLVRLLMAGLIGYVQAPAEGQ